MQSTRQGAFFAQLCVMSTHKVTPPTRGPLLGRASVAAAASAGQTPSYSHVGGMHTSVAPMCVRWCGFWGWLGVPPVRRNRRRASVLHATLVRPHHVSRSKSPHEVRMMVVLRLLGPHCATAERFASCCASCLCVVHRGSRWGAVGGPPHASAFPSAHPSYSRICCPCVLLVSIATC